MRNSELRFILALALLAGCSKTDRVDSLQVEERSIEARLESPGIGSKSHMNGLTVNWDKNDKVKVISTEGEADFTLQGEGDTPDGIFKGTLGGDFLAAVYPPSVFDSMSDDVMYVNIPAVQTYRENSFGPGDNISVAKIESEHALFKNIGGIIRFHLTGSDIISRIEIEGMAGEALCGKYSVIVSTGAATIFSDRGTKVTLDCGEGVQLLPDTEKEFCIVVPVDSFESGFTATFFDRNGRKLDRAYTKSSARILRKTITETSSREIIRDLCLEAGETANCYVVSAPGKYKFPANVMGNGITPENSEAPEITGMDNAVLLWETQNTSAAPETNSIVSVVEYSKGYVIFSTPAVLKPGNALIAVRDQSDKILWSWHIWIPGTAIGSHTDGDLTVMDRQMGALVATGSENRYDTQDYGFYYQWGRKDPFPAYSDRETKGGDICPAALTGTQITFSSAIGTYTQLAVHPTVVYSSDRKVVTDYNANAWKSNSDGKYGKKTMYDPCPAGWRVMSVPSLKLLQGHPAENDSAWDGVKITFRDGVLWLPNTGWMYNGGMITYNTGLGLWLNESLRENENYWAFKVKNGSSFTLRDDDIGKSDWRFSVVAEKDMQYVEGSGSASEKIDHYTGMEW